MKCPTSSLKHGSLLSPNSCHYFQSSSSSLDQIDLACWGGSNICLCFRVRARAAGTGQAPVSHGACSGPELLSRAISWTLGLEASADITNYHLLGCSYIMLQRTNCLPGECPLTQGHKERPLEGKQGDNEQSPYAARKR